MINNTYSPAFNNFQQLQNEYKQPNSKKSNTNTKALIGATIGTLIPLSLMMKKGGVKNPLKLEYKLKDMLTLSASSILGGAISGMAGENKESKINKLKEGTFQFLNTTLPMLCVTGGLKLCTKQRILNCTPCKILSVATGIMAGMLGALKLSNFIFDPKDRQPDRKLSPKDYLASADEAIGALALAKFPLVKAIQLDKALPLIYGYCGYRAGKTE